MFMKMVFCVLIQKTLVSWILQAFGAVEWHDCTANCGLKYTDAGNIDTILHHPPQRVSRALPPWCLG